MSLLLQNQFLCLALLQGRLKVFYHFSDELVELAPKDPTSQFLKISDVESKAVSQVADCPTGTLHVFTFN